MRRAAVLIMLALVIIPLAGCGRSDTAPKSGSDGDGVAGWKFTSGKRPTRAEYAALVASCQQGAVQSIRGKNLEACLAELGLRRE
jgi:hypothetical protein